MDICALSDGIVPANGFHKFETGIAAVIPDGYEIQVRPRSGLAAKSGIVAAFGTVDSGYRGGIGITLVSSLGTDFDVRAGDRIAQLVLAPVAIAHIEEVSEISTDTDRGSAGFGSTGV